MKEKNVIYKVRFKSTISEINNFDYPSMTIDDAEKFIRVSVCLWTKAAKNIIKSDDGKTVTLKCYVDDKLKDCAFTYERLWMTQEK